MSHYEISVDHSFKARHWLALPGGGREGPHEHTWRITATFRSQRLTEDTGVVLDFLDAKRALQTICGELDGADLNNMAAFAGGWPSAERLAQYIADRLAERAGMGELLARVRVAEAPGCSAAFCP